MNSQFAAVFKPAADHLTEVCDTKNNFPNPMTSEEQNLMIKERVAVQFYKAFGDPFGNRTEPGRQPAGQDCNPGHFPIGHSALILRHNPGAAKIEPEAHFAKTLLPYRELVISRLVAGMFAARSASQMIGC